MQHETKKDINGTNRFCTKINIKIRLPIGKKIFVIYHRIWKAANLCLPFLWSQRFNRKNWFRVSFDTKNWMILNNQWNVLNEQLIEYLCFWLFLDNIYGSNSIFSHIVKSARLHDYLLFFFRIFDEITVKQAHTYICLDFVGHNHGLTLCNLADYFLFKRNVRLFSTSPKITFYLSLAVRQLNACQKNRNVTLWEHFFHVDLKCKHAAYRYWKLLWHLSVVLKLLLIGFILVFQENIIWYISK